MRKLNIALVTILLLFNIGCTNPNVSSNKDLKDVIAYLDPNLKVEERINDLMSRMSVEDKVAQMIQGERNNVEYFQMKEKGIGSILSGGGSTPGNNELKDWTRMINAYQNAALDRELKIPMLYGIDAVHGHNNVYGATIFPHNIGLGIANDPDLMEQMGEIVGKEMLLTGIPWNFAPTVALALDQRWGRTYESFGTDANRTTTLASAYAKGLMNVGVMPTIKHFIGDGGTLYGTGLNGMLDRGDMSTTIEDLRTTHLKPYNQLIEDGVLVVMASYSSFNGTLMHQNKYLLTDLLKDELGFKGFVVSDWEAIHAINGSYYDQVVSSVNAGIDLLMEPNMWEKTYRTLIDAYHNGDITIERIDDAVQRILKVKFEIGLFEDPTQLSKVDENFTLREEHSKDIARMLVEKSSVLLKNESDLLPLKKDQLIYLTGPGANNIGMQCGGWTIQWQGDMESTDRITEGITIYEGLVSAGYNVTMDPSLAHTADVVVLVVGEKPYTEMVGDVEYADLYSKVAAPGNKESIEEAQSLNKPIVTILLAGRQLDIREEIKQWNSVIMSYLPGTEGDGITNLISGKSNFSGKLIDPWVDRNGILFELDYGLSY